MSGRTVPPGGGRRVAVFGGGPGGLTAAHELAERGFEVDVYERHEVPGGKARSFSLPDTGTEGRQDLPAELGPHLFWGAYRNLGETLARIPLGDGRTVVDAIAPTLTPGGGTFSRDGAALRVPLRRLGMGTWTVAPRSLVRCVSRALGSVWRLPPYDKALLACKFTALITSGRRRQWGQLEHLAVTDYLRADTLSPGGRQLLHVLMQQNTEPPERMNARVMATGNLHHFFVNALTRGLGPGFTSPLGLATGPTNEVWFDPWSAHLRTLGVRIRLRHTLTGLCCADGRITGATVRDAVGATHRVEADWYVLATPADRAAGLMRAEMIAADPALGGIGRLEQTWLGAMQFYLTRKQPGLPPAGILLRMPWTIAWLTPSNGVWNRDFPARYGNGSVVENVSFDIAGWDRPGIVHGRAAARCTPRQIFDEIRAQVRAELGDPTLLADADLHSWVLNPALTTDASGVLVHDEPDFATTPGCWADQPEAVTGIPNLFLAASYVRTTGGIEGMDCANEAGKKAANGVLAACGSPAPRARVASGTVPCALRSLWDLDDRRWLRGLPNAFDVVAPVAGTPVPTKG